MGLVYSSGYKPTESAKTLILLTTDNNTYSTGKQHEFFISFYDSSKQHICTVKTALRFTVFVPTGAAYFKLSGYGILIKDGNDYVLPSSSSSNPAPFKRLKACKADMCRCITFSQCTWHDTRTVVVYPRSVRGVMYDHCLFRNISNVHRQGKNGTYEGDFDHTTDLPYTHANWFVTHNLGDVEEDWPLLEGWSMIGCVCERTPTWWSEGRIISSEGISINGARGFTFMDNYNINIGEQGIEEALIINSYVPVYTVWRNYRFEHDCMFYRGLRSSANQDGFNPNGKRTIDYKNVNQDLNEPEWYGYRYNECDDPIMNDAALRDAFLDNYSKAMVQTSDGKINCRYHRSNVGGVKHK